MELNPDNIFVWSSYIDLFLKEKDYQKAKKMIEKAMKIDPNNPYFKVLLVRYCLEANIIKVEKIKDFLVGLSLKSSVEIRVVIYNMLGKSEENIERAREYFARSYEILPCNIVTLNTWAEKEIESGDLDKAEALLEEGVSIDEENAYIYKVKAKLAEKRGDREREREFIEKAKSLGLDIAS